MKNVVATDINGKKAEISEAEFQRSIIKYLREQSPDREMIIAEMQNNTGNPEPVPVAICMLAKNPEQILHYTDLIPLETEAEQ